MSEFKSFFKAVGGNEGGKCNYATRLDTYGCGCQHNCAYCYARALLDFRGLWNYKAPSVAPIEDIRQTITEVITPNKVAVRANKVKCIDYYASDYEILDETEGGTQIFTRRRSGRWVAEGQPDKSGSVYLVIGEREHRIDPSF